MCKSYLEPPERIGAVHVPVEEFGGLAGIVEHVLRGQALRLTDVADLVVLRGARVEGPAQEQFSHHAAQRPHVNSLTERQTYRQPHFIIHTYYKYIYTMLSNMNTAVKC